MVAGLSDEDSTRVRGLLVLPPGVWRVMAGGGAGLSELVVAGAVAGVRGR